MREPEQKLYLAVPADTFQSFFQETFIQEAVKSYQDSLLIYNPVQENIVLWKN
ncbi:MAG: element excision factor XisH family protein [Cyanobacteria bacterium P01_F01_bin.86]